MQYWSIKKVTNFRNKGFEVETLITPMFRQLCNKLLWLSTRRVNKLPPMLFLCEIPKEQTKIIKNYQRKAVKNRF